MPNVLYGSTPSQAWQLNLPYDAAAFNRQAVTARGLTDVSQMENQEAWRQAQMDEERRRNAQNMALQLFQMQQSAKQQAVQNALANRQLDIGQRNTDALRGLQERQLNWQESQPSQKDLLELQATLGEKGKMDVFTAQQAEKEDQKVAAIDAFVAGKNQLEALGNAVDVLNKTWTPLEVQHTGMPVTGLWKAMPDEDIAKVRGAIAGVLGQDAADAMRITDFTTAKQAIAQAAQILNAQKAALQEELTRVHRTTGIGIYALPKTNEEGKEERADGGIRQWVSQYLRRFPKRNVESELPSQPAAPRRKAAPIEGTEDWFDAQGYAPRAPLLGPSTTANLPVR